MEVKYSVGDKVRIKKDFDKMRYPHDPGVVPEMIDYAENEYDVKFGYELDDRPEPVYTLIGNSWSWAESWLEPVIVYNIKEINDAELEDMFR